MSTPDKNEARRCGEKLLVVVGATEQRVHRQNKQFFFSFFISLVFLPKERTFLITQKTPRCAEQLDAA